MSKPTYYIWSTDYTHDEEYKIQKEKYLRLGFRVVTFQDGQNQEDIHQGIKNIIRNHYNEIFS